MTVLITGIGLLTTLGENAPQTWQRYLQGDTGLQPKGLPTGTVGVIGTTTQPLETILSQTVAEALADAGLAAPLVDGGVVVGSSRSFQAQWEAWLCTGEPSLPLNYWLERLPAAVSQQVAQQAGIVGPVLNPTAACATGIWAIAQGAMLIQQGQCEVVLAGAVESPLSPLTFAGFQRLGVLASERVAPFDRDRHGLGLAAGGAILVLESERHSRSRQVQPYGLIAGVGLTADAEQIAAPSLSQRGAIDAIQKALRQSQCTPAEIDYIHSHGTGTRLNDAAEAAWIQKLFGSHTPVTSSKGAVGHTLGAAGAIATALSCLSLKDQHIPPCVGCQHPAFDLDIVLKARAAHLRRILCCSYGFGGQNAVLVLAAP
ncbi:beta-ketoacyl-ACP synthase [Parathermosynechococcus lividus]